MCERLSCRAGPRKLKSGGGGDSEDGVFLPTGEEEEEEEEDMGVSEKMV